MDEQVICPNWPEPGVTKQIIGCGSSSVVQADDGLWDCVDCGIFFHAKPEEV